MKLKSIPSLGTRTVHLPVLGDTRVEDGVIDVADDKAKEFLACNCGYTFVSSDGSASAPLASSNILPTGEKTEAYPRASLDAMRVKDLDEVFASLDEILTEKEKTDYKDLKKADRADFLYGILNSDRVEVSEEEEEEKESEEGQEGEVQEGEGSQIPNV